MWMPRSLRSQSQTLFWWKFSGQVIDQKEEHCTGIVFLLQKRGDTSDTEVRLAHGSMRHSSLKKLPYRLVLVLLTFYFRCLGLDFFLKKIRFRIGRDSPYFLGIRKTVHVRSKTSSTRSGACFFPLFSATNMFLWVEFVWHVIGIIVYIIPVWGGNLWNSNITYFNYIDNQTSQSMSISYGNSDSSNWFLHFHGANDRVICNTFF